MKYQLFINRIGLSFSVFILVFIFSNGSQSQESSSLGVEQAVQANDVYEGQEIKFKPDWVLERDIRTGLYGNYSNDLRKPVNVNVKNGVVFLSGHVRTLEQRNEIEDQAYNAGAINVENNITTGREPFGPFNAYPAYDHLNHWHYDRFYNQ